MADKLAASPSGGDSFQRSKGSAGPAVGGMKMAFARRSISRIIYLLFRRGSPLLPCTEFLGKGGVEVHSLFSIVPYSDDVPGNGK